MEKGYVSIEDVKELIHQTRKEWAKATITTILATTFWWGVTLIYAICN